ncbi:unnamed protein product, partial [Allacma fusca]
MCGPCTQDGEWCALNSDCCSALCVYFECGPCREVGEWCMVDGDC